MAACARVDATIGAKFGHAFLRGCCGLRNIRSVAAAWIDQSGACQRVKRCLIGGGFLRLEPDRRGPSQSKPVQIIKKSAASILVLNGCGLDHLSEAAKARFYLGQSVAI